MFKVTTTTTTGLQSERKFDRLDLALFYAHTQFSSALVYSVLVRRVA